MSFVARLFKMTVCLFVSRHHRAGKSHAISIAHNSIENMAKLNCLGMTVINQSYNDEQIKIG
jgi:hypothetical protein